MEVALTAWIGIAVAAKAAHHQNSIRMLQKITDCREAVTAESADC
jgi:hypothetical protein